MIRVAAPVVEVAAEAELRDALLQLKGAVGPKVRSGPVWQLVAALWRGLGDQSP